VFTLPFQETGLADIATVGGKNASLGEMLRNLSTKGVRVPSGFSVTTEAYVDFLEANNLADFIQDELANLWPGDILSLEKTSGRIRQAILEGAFPEDIKKDIVVAYQDMEAQYGANCDVAVRSSATAEDLPKELEPSRLLSTRARLSFELRTLSLMSMLLSSAAIALNRRKKTRCWVFVALPAISLQLFPKPSL